MLTLLNWFRAQLPMLIQKAAANKNPQLYAEVLGDSLPANVDQAQLKAILQRPDWFTGLQGLAPAVAPYEGWFTQMRDELIAMIEDAEKERRAELIREQNAAGNAAGGDE